MLRGQMKNIPDRNTNASAGNINRVKDKSQQKYMEDHIEPEVKSQSSDSIEKYKKEERNVRKSR